ncbi:GNAT family N-acetyltransferase [Rivibacter subsaxonicus]|uniref:Acetyltransferase (GNAT) family protein n=1 Tax=Rivibacter subsaxonicus TaxID=457575 RepID=A0A4Q7VNZ8_9BURK|nr:GNAT family N-acetyltransferase [Rivibacter subsaxonicus]RZT97848.1 acetyltransferase (GNAT) family protein [Rivibacter subsaxonicus]
MKPAAFSAGAFRAVELGPADEAALQRFFEANPGYFLAVQGEPAAADAAHEELHGQPPADWPWTRQWQFGFVDAGGELVAMTDLVVDLLAPGVWHIGLFVVATPLHGGGAPRALYAALEDWMRAQGAQWLRLGVVLGNERAERFWERNGYAQMCRREGIAMGQRINTVRVMMKPLAGGTTEQYLALVERDRP